MIHNPQSTFKKIGSLLGVAVLLAACAVNSDDNKNQRHLEFSESWLFKEDSLIDASSPDYDAYSWEVIDLPHDWSVTDQRIQDSIHVGPFIKNLPQGVDVGYLRGGTGWYRKELIIEKGNAGKQVVIHFDGVHTEMTLWVNGAEVGQHVNGYTPFYFDITEYLHSPGIKNTLAIKVHKPVQDSRWFTGAGIYRQVSISYLDPVHIEPWGVFIKSEIIENGEAQIDLEILVKNNSKEKSDISIHAEIMAPGDSTAIVAETSGAVASMENQRFSMMVNIPKPQLWQMHDPVLYEARISVMNKGKIIDHFTQTFGIRTIVYSAENGFLLNGESVEMKGACMHHDNGLLGAVAFKAAEERRVRIMKENGYNAIRTSHNPPSQFFLEACDKLGMLVIDEAFDMWIKPKRPNDYHKHYEKWWESDLAAMVLRDRNHPSVIMWSFGNEVQERADSAGVEIGKKSIALIKSLDDTRPITQAICQFWDNPGKVWDDSAPAFEILDIGGYNYQWANYESDHAKFPERIMLGSESVPKEAFENWQLVEKHPYVIGDFVWTGMDYIGESGIGYSIFPKQTDEKIFLMPWPTYISWCGDIDIIGNKKPQSYYRDIVWGESEIEILVHEAIPDGKKEVTSFWGWPNELPHWNWEGNEGKNLEVRVFSSYPVVRLELNGKVIGEKAISETDKLTATFNVAYEPGKLVAIGVAGGVDKETKELTTSGAVKALKVHAERDSISTGSAEIAYLQVTAVDAEGRLVSTANAVINVDVEGEATLLAAGNANPQVEGSFTDTSFRLYRGSGLVIIKSTGIAGEIRVLLKAEGVEDAEIHILAVP